MPFLPLMKTSLYICDDTNKNVEEESQKGIASTEGELSALDHVDLSSPGFQSLIEPA